MINWVNEVCKWPFKRIIPCHLENNLKATSVDFKRAFNFLYEPETGVNTQKSWASILSTLTFSSPANRIVYPAPLEEDLAVLANASKELTQSGVLYPEGKLLKRKA